MKIQNSRILVLFFFLVIYSSAHAQWMQWESRSNNTLDEFGKYVTDMIDRGYAPVNISCVTISDKPKISSIWQKGNIEDWACWYDMNQTAFVNKINEFDQKKLSPVDITVWEDHGETRFAAIWQKTEYEGVTEIGITPDNLRSKIIGWADKGYSLKDLNGYSVNGQVKYTCIFDKQARGTLSIAYGKTETEFQAEFDKLTPLGYYPIDINYFNDGGVIKCNGIWAITNETWESRGGYNADEFQVFLDKKTDEGFIPIDIDQYLFNGAVKFRATLTKSKKGNIATPEYVSQNVLSSANTQSQLSISPVEQQTQVWCWLATGEMIFRYFNLPNLNPGNNYQCGIIGSIFPNTPCGSDCFNSVCIRGSGSNANTVKMLKDYAWISSGKVFSCTESYELGFDIIKSNIDQRKPILCGVSPNRRQYYYGAEHVILLIGYQVRMNIPYVIINDPFPYSSNDNPYLKAGASELQQNQYLIRLETFTKTIFWHWSLSDIRIQ
ncbi:MAG: papain-like cysteine protease family protein [Bacteroidia bacterium]